MSEKAGISCPNCKRHIEIEYHAGFNVAQEDEYRENYSCDADISCPKCGKEITLYGTIFVHNIKLTGTKIPDWEPNP